MSLNKASMESKKIKASSFCSGIGSFEVAMKNLEIPHEINFACEIDKYARQSYLANHECETMYHDMTKEDYVGEHWYSDINVSGIPCQAFSLAGKKLGELDPRGLLFFDFYRYVKNQMPKYFIIENVKGLLSDNGGATFQNWINLLGQSVNGDQFIFPHEDSLMYNLHWQVLNTKDYGLPQNRERVFLIGIRNDLPNSFVFPKGVPLKLRLKDILEEEVDEKYYLSSESIDNLMEHKRRNDEAGNGFGVKFNEEDGICSTIKIGGSGKDDLVKIKSATKSGYEIATEGDSINLEHPNSETRRGRVGKQVAQTLTTSCNQGVMIGAMRGRYDKSGKTNQELEIKDDNISNTLTSVQKDNLVIQINPSTESGGVQPYQQNRIYDSEGIAPALCRGKSDLNVTEIIQLNNPTHSNDRVYSDEGISPTLNTMQGGNRQPFIAQYTGIAVHPLSKKLEFDGFKDGNSPALLATDYKAPKCVQYSDYRIRKLTPLECFRLQGFSDQFHQNTVEAGVSASQRYKQAGNSISVPVIQAILKNLLKDYIEE